MGSKFLALFGEDEAGVRNVLVLKVLGVGERKGREEEEKRVERKEGEEEREPPKEHLNRSADAFRSRLFSSTLAPSPMLLQRSLNVQGDTDVCFPHLRLDHLGARERLDEPDDVDGLEPERRRKVARVDRRRRVAIRLLREGQEQGVLELL